LKVKFIINPIAGKKRDIKKEIQKIEEIASAKRAQADFHITNSPREAIEIAQQSINKGYDKIAAVGGDGTMNEVATSLVRSSIPMGIIPKGSGNGLARALGIPLTLEKACETLFENHFTYIDVGIINNRKFFNVAGIGFDAQIGWHYNQKYHKSRGFLSYILSGFHVYFKLDREEVAIMFNDKNINITPLLITIANSNQYGSGAIIAPTADLSDGLFDVCIIDDIGFFTGLFHLPKLFSGAIEKVPHINIYKANSIHIIRKNPGPMQTDGEAYMGEKHLKISLLPKALKICIPDKKGPF
jgi:YegS/Rv2252/BmrU family lipid kinase